MVFRILMCVAALAACVCGMGLGNEASTPYSGYDYPRSNFLVGLAGLAFFFVYKDRKNLRTFVVRSMYRASPAVAAYGFGYYYAVKSNPWNWMFNPNDPEKVFMVLEPITYQIIFLFLGLTPVMVLIYDQIVAYRAKDVV